MYLAAYPNTASKASAAVSNVNSREGSAKWKYAKVPTIAKLMRNDIVSEPELSIEL